MKLHRHLLKFEKFLKYSKSVDMMRTTRDISFLQDQIMCVVDEMFLIHVTINVNATFWGKWKGFSVTFAYLQESLIFNL